MNTTFMTYKEETEVLRETIAAQAVVIEKLRSVLEKLACLGNGDEHGNSIGNCIAIEALSIPTDSKEVLKAWLDEVLGEPVAWWRKDKHGVTWYYSQDEDHHEGSIPLFRKPEGV